MTSKHIIYLASGSARRFGSNKLLAPLAGKPLYLHTLEMLHGLIQSREDCRLTVVSRYTEIRERAHSLGIQAVDSPESEKGASYTIKAGLQALEERPDYLLFVVADQPWLTARSLEKLLNLAESGVKTACLSFRGAPGNPVLFSAELIPELMLLEGDRGGRAVARRYDPILVEADREEELRDIDYDTDLRMMQ